MDDERAVLVIGGTGFVGRRVVAALVAGGHRVRCMVRDPSRAADLSADGVEVVRGDMLDAEAVSAAARGVRAVIVCVHTLSPQPGRRAGQDFVDVEADGVGSIVAACRANGARRLLYVTSIGVAHGARSSWLRGRADVEDLLFGSGLDVTVLRPGMVVGHGGDGFGMVERGARRRAAILLASPHQRFRTVAVDDLAHQLVALLDEPRSWTSRARSGSTSTSAATTCSPSTRWSTSPLIIWADVSRPRSTCPAACSPASPRSSSVPRRCHPVRSAGSSGRAATRTWSVTPLPSAPCSNARPARSTKP